MILQTSQQLCLPTSLSSGAALDFVQQPALLLKQLHFLQHLQQQGPQINGVLALQVPMLGEVTLPFLSVIEPCTDGAQLLSQPLSEERAWLELTGQGQVSNGALDYNFTFRAHIQTPPAEQWGSRAFEKMVQATAQRSISRITEALPAAFERALHLAQASDPTKATAKSI